MGIVFHSTYPLEVYKKRKPKRHVSSASTSQQLTKQNKHFLKSLGFKLVK